jgi:hypothetical protein
MSAGPITVNSGVVLTIPSGSTYTIVWVSSKQTQSRSDNLTQQRRTSRWQCHLHQTARLSWLGAMLALGFGFLIKTNEPLRLHKRQTRLRSRTRTLGKRRIRYLIYERKH